MIGVAPRRVWRGLLWLALVILGQAFSVAAMAQTPNVWPERPVRIVVGFPPGGPTDFVARLIAPGLAAAWKQQVIIDNRGGANGTIGTDFVAKAPPDGMTLLFSGNNIVMNTGLYRLPYDMIRDFTPVAMIAFSPNVLWVGPNEPYRSLADLVAAARSKPGELGYATTGNGGNGHFGGETLKRALGIDITHVPYRGTAPAVQDLLANVVQLTMTGAPAVLPHVEAGTLRALGISSLKRVPAMKDIPTIAEQGYPGFEADQWYGILAPAGTPQPIVDRLNAEIRKAMTDKEIVSALARDGADVWVTTPEEFRDFIAKEIPRWAEVVKAAKIKID